MSEITVLIADGGATARQLAELLPGNARITSVATFDEALRQLEFAPPDVLFTDHQLPDADGLQLVQAARSLRHPPATVMMSANSSPECIIAAYRKGICDFLVKPLTEDNVRESLNQATSESAIRRTYRLDTSDSPMRTLPPPISCSLKELESSAMSDALQRSNGNKAKAARLLGVSRRTLYRMLSRSQPES